MITREGFTLRATEGASYQWYRNGTPVARATKRQYTVERSGSYAVLVRSQAQCGSRSDDIELAVGQARLDIGDIRAATGDTVTVSIVLVSARNLDNAGASECAVTLAVPAGGLDILKGGSVSTSASGISVRLKGPVVSSGSVLFRVRARVTARRGRVPLRLKDVEWGGALVKTAAGQGTLRVVRR
jgi:hypothetical protein